MVSTGSTTSPGAWVPASAGPDEVYDAFTGWVAR
jgi:hypothetical protein